MHEFKQTVIENNSIRYHEMHTENQEVEKFCFGMSGWNGSHNSTQSKRSTGHNIILSLSN